MKPLFLFFCDDYVNELNKYKKISINSSFSNIGVRSDFISPKELLNKKIEDNTFYENSRLTKLLELAKKNKSKIELIGNYDDLENLDALLSFMDKKEYKKVYLNIVGVNKTTKYDKRKISKVDSYDYKKMFSSKTYKLSLNDIAIFYNVNQDNFKDIISKIKKTKNAPKIVKFMGGKDSIIELPKYETLGNIIDTNGLKQLRCNIDSYRFDGMQNIKYKNCKSIKSGFFKEDLSNYDLVMYKVPKKDLNKVIEYINENKVDFLMLTRKENQNIVISSYSNIIKEASASMIMPTILKLLNIKVDEKTILEEESMKAIIFEVISVLFIISSMVFYLSRLLHFYLTK